MPVIPVLHMLKQTNTYKKKKIDCFEFDVHISPIAKYCLRHKTNQLNTRGRPLYINESRPLNTKL